LQPQEVEGLSLAMKKRVGILISGRGSNMMALVQAARAAEYPAEIATVISSAPDAPGLAWARAQGLSVVGLDHKAYPSREAFDAAVHGALAEAGVELVALAGFMRIQSAGFVERWQGRQLNIHPSLLPLFKGRHPHRQALDAGVRLSGCTVHFVTAEMDSGPIVAQAAVPVLDGDTPERLAERVLAAEHRLYPHALALVASGLTWIMDNRVRIRLPESPHGWLMAPQP
jgi:phosphoribosylglycinamide formyltransferase 1